ncbi:MAG TPA: AtpZ/AtpI family protein [Chitinophagales bacterium]|nr:AtpZ/AtpI family protein [Chitinophagales bacterium]MCB9074793.1 AtpZ/AtpI family protein [Chitinophagales bacterium]HMU97188.1 AtpZ/AtpI family protein [Chitinophagales bacterium]HMV02404.1 AtpZ/AtpI family protein [Chitinophagales bacterium]HMW94014.1 AtpZ/AtpI family protein [Chitinophagales bacterium]
MQLKKSDKNQGLRQQLLAFSGMAFELLITIGIFTFIGIQIDKRIALKLPVATVVMCLFGLIVGFYFIFKQLKKL